MGRLITPLPRVGLTQGDGHSGDIRLGGALEMTGDRVPVDAEFKV